MIEITFVNGATRTFWTIDETAKAVNSYASRIAAIDIYCWKFDGKLPECLRACTRLKRLRCSGATELPEWIGELASLKRIDCANCLIETLPDSFGSLGKLKGLFLSFNRLTDVSVICKCRALETVDISGNRIFMLPESIGDDLPNLVSFTACCNQLRWIPKSFNNCLRLEHMDVSRNKDVEEVPDFDKCPCLRSLYVRNTWAKIPRGLAERPGMHLLEGFTRDVFPE